MTATPITSPSTAPSPAVQEACAALQAAGILCTASDPPAEILAHLQEVILAVVVQDEAVFDRAHFDHLMACWDAVHDEGVITDVTSP